jgi:hypothetical protein
LSSDAEGRFTLAGAWRSAVEQRLEEDPAFARSLQTPEGAEALSAALEGVMEETAPRVLDTILEDAQKTLAENRQMRDDFEQTIRDVGVTRLISLRYSSASA